MRVGPKWDYCELAGLRFQRGELGRTWAPLSPLLMLSNNVAWAIRHPEIPSAWVNLDFADP